MADKRDYYEVLGLKKGASEDEIKKAYRRLAKDNQPDLHPGDKEAENRFKEINEIRRSAGITISSALPAWIPATRLSRAAVSAASAERASATLTWGIFLIPSSAKTIIIFR